MPVTYINRRKDKYYLHVSKTKKGNPKYHFSKSYTGILSDRIPNGYEIYENPNAQVFLRKKMPKLWKNMEIQIIEKSIKKNSAVYDYRVDVRRDTLTIYVSDQGESFYNDSKKMASPFMGQNELREILQEFLTFSPMMRFTLIDTEERIFAVERYCYLVEGGWLFLDSGPDLKKLADEFCQHLGRDSFFELL